MVLYERAHGFCLQYIWSTSWMSNDSDTPPSLSFPFYPECTLSYFSILFWCTIEGKECLLAFFLIFSRSYSNILGPTFQLWDPSCKFPFLFGIWSLIIIYDGGVEKLLCNDNYKTKWYFYKSVTVNSDGRSVSSQEVWAMTGRSRSGQQPTHCQEDPEVLEDKNNHFIEIVNLCNVHSEMRCKISCPMRQGSGKKKNINSWLCTCLRIILEL